MTRYSLSGLLLIGLLLVLSACTLTHEELLAWDRRDCTGFGFQPDSRAYADCLLRLDAARQAHGHDHLHSDRL
jgi:hypothetical protein